MDAGGTPTWKWAIELRREQQPRAMHGAIAEDEGAVKSTSYPLTPTLSQKGERVNGTVVILFLKKYPDKQGI